MHRPKYFVVMNAITEIMFRDKQSTSPPFFSPPIFISPFNWLCPQ
jgi:hypothetical protein